MADKDNKSKLTYHVWDKDNNEYDIPDEVVQQRGMDNFAKDFEGGYITMFDDKKQKVDVPIEDVGEYRKQGYILYDTSGNATPINEVGKKPSPSSPSQGTEQTQYPQEVLDAFNSPDNKPGNFKDLAQLNDEYQRGELKKPSLISQALGMMPKVDAGNIGREQKMGGMITSMLLGGNEQQAQPLQQPQDNNQQVQQTEQTQQISAKDVDATTGAAPVQQVDAVYNKYVGKGDALSETMYDLMQSGQAQNQEEAQQMAMGAMNRAASRLAQRTTDEFVSKLGDTVEGVDEAVMNGWHSHAVQDKLKKLASQYGIMNSVAVDENGQYITQTNGYDQFINGMVKPAMVESLVKKYGENYRKAAEDLATRLYSNDEVIQNQLMNQDIDEALSSVISKYVNPSVVDEYNKAQEAGSKAFNEGMEGSQNIPASFRLGTAIASQYEANQAKDPQKTLSALQKRFNGLYKNPRFLNDMSNAAFKVMQRYGMNGTLSGNPKQFKPMIDEVLKAQLNQLEVKNMIPKGSAEYIMNTGLSNTIVGKITRKLVQTDYQNWLEDIANQQYQPGFWENVASGALTFAGDAWSYWLPGAAGGKLTKSMIAKAEGKLAGDLMAKGMERKVAERAAKVLIGKSKDVALKNGAVHGAVTFGGQSAISKPIDEVYRTGQFDENGKVYNPSVGKIIANTLGEVTKQITVGAIMQGGTIANMIGKGRGLATNILADVGGKVVDSGIMTGQQLLERMAHDPNFKSTGKDVAESFLESMANLTAIGLPGMMGKYARFKDAKEFNRKFEFSDQDIQELKRFGYDGLRDAFEKMGIGEYAVVGDNAQRLDGQLTQKYMDLMNDKSVPEVLKAKMMAVVEGKRPSSFSPVVDSEVYRGDDGKYYLETYNKDGGVIDRKEYSSHDAARKDEKKLENEKTLGLASVLEGEFHNEFTQEHLEGLYNKAAQKYNMGEKLTDEDKAAVYLHQNAGAIKEIMDKQQKGIILTEEEQKQVNAYRHYYDNALENSSVMREFVNTFEDSHGVARGTLRKALESKDKKYAPLVESYLKELYNSIELKREMKQTMDDLYNTAHGNEQKRIEQSGVEGEKPATPVEGAAPVDGSAGGQESPVSSGPAPYQDSTNSVPSPSDANSAANLANSSAEVPPTEPPTPPVEGETASNESKSDAYMMGQNAYRNGDAEGLKAIDHNDDVSKARLKRAFADDEAMMDVVVKAYEEGKDMEQFVAQRANSMTTAQQDAVRKYVEAQDAKKGVYDALQHADDSYSDALKEQLWPYQTEDGNIVPATLTTGQQVFLKKANEYGGGFVVVPGDDGNPTIKQVASADIKEVGTPIPLDEYINQKVTEQVDARYKQFRSQFDGSGFKRGDIVSVSMEAGDEPSDVKIVGYTEDGRVILTDTDVDVNSQIDTNKLEFVAKDEFNSWRQNAIDSSVGAELDAEDAQRANDDAAKAEADKKQRYNEGIVGLGMGQPDYSSKDTEPKVAAEYLQEQFGNDHGKLMNLISGSRSDIKEQLDNKRKAASEYEEWLSLNADLDPEKAQKVENDLALVNEQIADLETRYKNWNAIRKEVMTPEEARTLKNERKAEIENAGVDDSVGSPSDEREVAVLDNKDLKKQYPTMDEASNYIASERKRIYHIQNDEVQPQIDDINEALEQYMNGDIDYSADQLKELNTTKAQLEARQANLSASAKDLKAQDKLLNTLYSAENKEERAKAMEEMTPSEQRKALVAVAFKKNDLGAIKEIYKDASIDVMDLTPQTLEEAVSQALHPHSLNAESLQPELGKDNFKYGIGKGYDSNKFNYLLAKKGTGLSVNEFAVRVYNDLPVNLQDMGYSDQDVRNTLLDMFKTYDNVKEMRNVALMNRIAAAEEELSAEDEWYEAQKEREIIERQAEIEEYNSYIQDKTVSLPSESELNAIEGMEYDRMMEADEREREYKEYVKSILPELADYDDRSNEEGYGGSRGLGSDSSRRGVDEGNSQGEEISGREASSQSEIGESTDSGRTGRQETGSMERGEGSAIRGTHLPQEASFGERLKNAISETEPNPSEAQKKAGNYKKGHLSFGGYDFTVETPKGTTRSGKDEQGKPWSVTMHDTYGYILGKIGVDGDHIDMFINDAADLDTFDGNVYVVDQVNPETGEFDEHKVMYGYPSEEAATEAYLANYSKGWKGLGKVTAVPKATFDKWLEASDRKTKPFADYAMVQKEQRATYKEEMMQDGAHSEAFDKIVELAKEQKQYWDLMEQGEVEPDDVPEVDVAFDMDELLKTLSDEEFKEVSDVLKGIDEEFEYFTADEYERREGTVERKKKADNAMTNDESIKQALKPVTPFANALKSAVESGDKKSIKKAQKELTDALIASDLGHDYLSGQLAQAKLAKKKDELYKVKRATVKPLTDALHAIENAENIENSDFISQMEYDYENDIHPSEEDKPKMQKFVERLLNFHSDKEDKTDSGYTILSSNIQGDKLYPNEKKWFGTGKYRKGVSWVDKQNNCAYEVNPRFNNRGYLSAVGVHKIVPLIKFDRDVKEVKPSEMTEAQKVAYDAVSTMLKKAGIPVKVISNEDMEKVAEEQDNLAISMLMSDPHLRFNIKTPEQKKAAKAAYDWATEHRPDKWNQYAIVNMDNPNQMPEYFEKKSLAEQWRKYYTNAWRIGNYKAFDLNKPFEEQVKNVVGRVPSEFDPYKADAQNHERNELKKQIKETEDAYNSTGQERNNYQIQLMKEYMDEHGLASENDIPDDVWSKLNDKAHEKYQDKLDSLFAKYKDLDRQLKAIAGLGVRFLRTYHGSGSDFTEFDFDHMGEGAGSQTFGWGGYVTSSKKIGKSYATLMDNDPSMAYYRIQRSNGTRFVKKYPTLESFLHGDKQIAMNDKFTEQEKIDYYNDMKKLAEPYHNLYEVDIPDDNGSNYLDFENPMSEEQVNTIREALAKKGVDVSSWESRGFKLDLPFKDVYAAVLPMMMRSTPKEVSKFLSSLGYTGIKYPAGTIHGGAEEGDTNYVIFKPSDMQIVDHNKFAKGKGTVYGYTDGNEIVLNQEHLNPNTPIHEYQHIWRTAAKAKNPELIEHGDNLIKQTEWFKNLQSDPNYKHLSEEKLCDEAFARLTGDEGEAILEQMAKDAIKENPLDTAKELSIINRLKKWLKQFWYWTLETFTKWKPEDIKKMTLEDIRNLVLRDLAQGVDPRTVLNEKKAKKAEDNKTMFGMHNISLDKLRKAIKQGGFAAPSMGVIDSKNGIYSDYGEITLIPKAEKLAKSKGKNAGTFTADAWTPTYPQVERIMNKQGEKAFNTDMNEKLGDVDNGIYSNIRESWKGYLASGDVRDGLYWHYLFDKGMNPETIYQSGKYDNDVTNEVMRISANGNKIDYTDEEVAELIQLMNKATGKDNDVDAQREKLKARIASAEKQGNHLLAALKKKRLAELEGVENFYIAADFVNDVVRNNRKNGKVDVHDTMDAAKEKVENDKKLSADFPSWLDKKTEEYGVEEMLYNGTTPSGRPKYIPNTIDNAVKLMKKQGVAGGYTAFGSELGVFIAKNSPEVNTLAAMKNAKDKLIPFGDERHNQIKDKITKEFLELSDEIRVGSDNRFMFDDSGVARMVELADHKGNEKEYLKKAYNVEVSDEWMDRYNKLLDTIKKDYKVFYFETKFMRPYGLDEFDKAIVPKGTPKDVIDALKKAGIDVHTYEGKEDREKVTMDAINNSEDIRFMFAGEKGAGEVEARNVEKRLGMTDEERRNSLASETEDVNRDEQIVMNGNEASYSIVKDPETIKKLDKEDTVKVYRAMQVGEDGKLYPPMAAKVKGKFVEPIELGKWEQADERPELADDKGMFTLNKGNGKSLKAAYNPYLHTSRTPLNDQFSEAQNRPNIVTVEVEVPKSELTSGYKADKAKDAVGEVEWKAGIIQGQLTGKRKVVLSRWDKPVRIVPDSEVADVIVNDMFKGKNITMPSNVVTPSLRKELEKRGVPFVETDNRGRIVGGENDGVHYSKVYGKKANVKHRFGEPYDYEKYPLGRVEPNLATKEVKIVRADANHGFKDYKEAKDWAIGNICRTYSSDETGNKGEVIINKDVVSKYVSKAARDQSDNDDVHYAVLKVLPDVIREGIEAETHPNFNKVGNARKPEYGYDNHLLIHRVYGAVDIDGVVYRVKITMKENMQDRSLPNKPYSYEVTDISTKIEPLEAIDAQAQGHSSHSNDSISGANLLKNVEMSYDKGKKLLDESEKMGISAENQRKIADSVVNTANQLGGAEANVYTSLDDVPEEYRSEVEQGAKGWYDPETHTVHVYLPNCADADEAQRTVFHEKIGHEGMEVLLGGEQGVRKFADFAYKSVGKETRGKILDFANKYDPGWSNPDRINVGTQEYIAHLAEEGPTTAEDFSLWTKIKHYLIKVLKKLGIRVPGLLNDKDLRYYLMKAGKALHVWDNMPKEKQEAMMAQASNAEIKDALSDGAGKGKPRQKKGESAIQYMKRVMEWKRWKEAREDKEDPEPPMFYDFDKDAEGKKEWERLNKEWRESHGLRGEEMPLRPERKEGESDESFLNRYKEWEKWNDAMGDKENPMPDMFSFEKSKQDEARQKYEDWLTRHELNEQQQADLDLYEGKIYPAETNPEADALEQEVMQDLAEVTSTDVSKEGAATTVKHAVIHRRKNMEEASADDAIYINDVKNSIEKMAESGAFDKLLSDYQGKPNKAEKLAEAIPYIIEAPRRIREIAYKLNSTGVFCEGHIHITPNDVEAIQELRPQLAEVTAKKHTELKDGKEVELFDDMKGASEVASKMADIINGNHEKEPGFVPIDGTDILNKNVLPIILKRITPYGVDYKNLSEPMKSVLDSIRDWYNYTFDWLKDNNTLKADTGFTVDYVNHLWDKEKSDKNAYAMYVENRQRTKSPNEKPRQINTIMEGLEVGLVPKTTDITKMMAYYSRSNIEAWANKTMLQEVSGLNVIERNEDGEIISSDPLLSSVAPFNLEQYKYFEIPGVGPVWVYNVSPKQMKVKNPITGKDKVLYSEASAGDRFGVVFDTYQSTPFWKAFDTMASSMKKLELGFSGFHAGALTEVYMVQNMVEYGPKKALANFMKYIFADTMKNHQLPCFANPQDFQEAATHLVKFGATNDYAAADVQNMFDNFRDSMMKVQEKLDNGNVVSKAGATISIPFKVASQMLSLINKGMDRALWDFLHDGLKLATYNMRAEKTKARAKAKGWTDEQLSKALDEDGQFVNDMFGGQHWDVLGASHRTLRYAGRVLLSPDWNASTTRHFLALTGYGSVWNEATLENFKEYYKRLYHKNLTPEDEGRRARQISSLLCYGLGFMVFYEAIANGINAAFRALDEEKERKKAEELRKTNPNYRSPYELAYPDGMKWYDYLMRGNSLGQQSKIFMGRYADGTEMYIRHGKQFREVPEYLFNHKGELEFPGPMVQRMIGKANPMVRMTLDDINYLSDFQASHADQEIQRKYGKTIGLLYKDALYWAPFLIPSQENKEFKAVDFFFPSSKGFSPWKAQSYFKDFILSGDMEGVVMTYQSCERNGIDPEEQIKAAIGSVKALEASEMQDGVTSLQVASERFDEAKSITEKKKMRQKMKKFLSQSDYKAFTQKEALDMVQSYLNGEDDLKEMEKAENKYLMKAKAEDVTEDWRIQAVWNGTMETYDEYQRLKDVDKAKANAFKNSKTNKRLFAARKAISAAKKKMNKAKKQMNGQNDAAKMVEIRKTRKELLKTLNGME